MGGNTMWRQASFRGVPFLVDAFEHSSGRRGPDHEFPSKDKGFPEDLGKQIGKFTFQAYVVRSVVDPDYAGQRDALIAALDQQGSGELVHPAFGTLSVQARPWSVSESRTKLGMAVFSLSFIEASAPTYPTATRASAAGMPSSAQSAHTAAANLFGDRFSLAGKHDYLRDRAAERLSGLGDRYHRLSAMNGLPLDIAGLVRTAVDMVLGKASGDNAALAAAIAALARAVTEYHERPWRRKRNQDGTYRGTESRLSSGPLSPLAVVSLARMFEATEIPVPVSDRQYSSLCRAERVNAEAIETYGRQTAMIEAARVAPFVRWLTLDDAEQYRDRIADALDYEAEITDDDEVYRAFTAMRVLVIQSVTPDDGSLPRLVDHVPARTMPALVLSYKLYGDAGQADELAEINGLRHPGFIPGAERIRVLSNA